MSPLQNLKSAIEHIRSKPFPDNERAVEIKVILPLLSALGWDVHEDEVRYQYKVGGTRSRSQGVVDIALFGARGALCFIEAKNTDERLDNHVGQLLGYAFYEGVVLCALTNGREWWLYLPREGGKPETRKFAQLNLGTDTSDDLSEQMQLFLSKNNLESGQAESAGKERLLGSRERDIWKQMLEKSDRGLVEAIMSRIERETGTRPSQSRVSALLSETHFGVSTIGSDTEIARPVRREVRTEPKKLTMTPPPKIYGVRLWGQLTEVQNWSSAYILLGNELYKRHSDKFFETAKVLSGSRYPWFSYDKEACSTTVREAKFLEASSPRIYVLVPGKVENIRKMTKRLLEAFGYSSEDTNIWETITEKPTGIPQRTFGESSL